MAAVRPRGEVDATAGGSVRAPVETEGGRAVRRRVETFPAHVDTFSSSQLPAQAYEENRAAPATESRAASAAGSKNESTYK